LRLALLGLYLQFYLNKVSFVVRSTTYFLLNKEQIGVCRYTYFRTNITAQTRVSLILRAVLRKTVWAPTTITSKAATDN
jgi:hypothetical protein